MSLPLHSRGSISPSFPNSIWERLLSPRNSISRQSFPSFPSCTWERTCPRNFVASVGRKPGFSDRCLVLAFLLILSLLLSPALFADTTDPELDAANRAFTYGSYAESAQLFQKIIAARGYSASLCFNLANAEAKAGHPGLAMLNYERARYLAPGDADINHNLQLARQQAGLDPNSYRWWQAMLHSINWTVWLALIVSCLTLLLLSLIGTSFAPAIASALKIPLPVLRTIFRAIFFICIPLALIFGFVELACIGFNNRIEGVIVAPKEATLRLSPFDGAESVGTIPEGELVTVEDRHDDYLRIEARDHHFGWIQQKDIEPVIADTFNPPQ